MAVIDTDELITVTQANQMGVSGLIKEAESGHKKVVLRNGKPVAVVVGIEDYELGQRRTDDLEDLALAAARMLTSTDHRHSLDDVLDRFGYTREELRALNED
jgi:prevent-host-death family protein